MYLFEVKDMLSKAFKDTAVQKDALACRIAVKLIVDEPESSENPIVLWGGRDEAGQVVCRASQAVWRQVFSLSPSPGYQSFSALKRLTAEFTVDADELHWVQALPLMERLLEAMRGTLSLAAINTPRHFSALRHIQGNYLQLESKPDTWVYYESCGDKSKPTLLMLHTAGSDSRQWHGLIAQDEIREHWHLLAFDLPGHGRSPLPVGHANWTWQLDQDQYIDWILKFLNNINIERVTLMGCSMGAAISLPLLARYPDQFQGALLLETPYYSPGRRTPFLNQSEVHGARLSAAWVGALLSPSSPTAERDYATWIYSQGAPSVYDGDLAFYSDQFKASDHTAAIQTSRTPIWMFTGDYDYSATPEDSKRVAQEIPGSNFQELKGFGHFPMVENPDGLMPFISGALKELNRSMLQFADK